MSIKEIVEAVFTEGVRYQRYTNIVGGSGHAKQAEAEKNRLKAKLEKKVKNIIGRFDGEGDGWDIAFNPCCPGDDIANYRNCLRLEQYQRAGLPVSKAEYEKSGYIYRPKK